MDAPIVAVAAREPAAGLPGRRGSPDGRRAPGRAASAGDVLEVERLRSQLAEAAAGRRFLLQGGACAESFDDCRPEVITDKLKILLQMSLVLTYGLKRQIIRVGRFAGQYANRAPSP
jgi:3-deoxy-D-arabino-heptulosonate 7-phosphate (DAHP) synthase class II